MRRGHDAEKRPYSNSLLVICADLDCVCGGLAQQSPLPVLKSAKISSTLNNIFQVFCVRLLGSHISFAASCRQLSLFTCGEKPLHFGNSKFLFSFVCFVLKLACKPQCNCDSGNVPVFILCLVFFSEQLKVKQTARGGRSIFVSPVFVINSVVHDVCFAHRSTVKTFDNCVVQKIQKKGPENSDGQSGAGAACKNACTVCPPNEDQCTSVFAENFLFPIYFVL